MHAMFVDNISESNTFFFVLKWVFVRRWSAGSFAERCSSYHSLDSLYISCIIAHVIIIIHNIYTCTCDISSYLSIVFASKHVQHPASPVDPKKAWEGMYIPSVADQHREMEYPTKSAPIPSMGVWHLTFFEAMVNWPLALVFKSYDIHDFTGSMHVYVIHVDGFESLLAILSKLRPRWSCWRKYGVEGGLQNGGIDYDSFDGFHLGSPDFTISFSVLESQPGDGIYFECLQKFRRSSATERTLIYRWLKG